MTQQILLDMDGVLADFFSSAMRVHGRDPVEELHRWPAAHWDMHEVLGITEDEFWLPMEGVEFWHGLQPYPWAVELVTRLSEVAPVTIASSPSRDPDCRAAKTRWIYQHLPMVRPRDVMLGSKKWLMANPRHVLIDDADSNVFKFAAHGGMAVLFPQKWNSLHEVASTLRDSERVAYILAALQTGAVIR